MRAKGKVLLIIVGVSLFVRGGTRAASITLQWNPSPSSGVTGYTLYWTLPDGSGAVSYDVGNGTQARVDNLTEGQTYNFYATAHDNSGNESSPSNTLVYTVPVPGPISGGGAVTFIKADTGTRGSWKGVYGSEGYSMAAVPPTLPSYATLTTSAPQWTWTANSAQPAHLQDPRNPTNRIAACWYSSTQVAYDLALTDGKSHRVGMYFLDASNSGRQQRVDIIDPVNGATLYSRQLTSFSSGIYLVWEIGGRVNIRVTPSVGNAVVSGVFFDGLPAPGPATSARFVKSDASTRGDWKGVYGNQGYSIAGASASLPTYATFATTAPQWTWAAQTPSPSALILPGGSNTRIAACWYSATEVGFDFGVTDGQPHLVSVYFLDASASGRQQRVDVVDRTTGAILDTRSIANFATGLYLSWEVAGNVSIRLTPSNVNAVASGIFFDATPGNTPPPADNQYPCDVKNRLINAYCTISSNATTIIIPPHPVRTETTIERRTFSNRPSAWGLWTNIFTLNSASVTNSISFTDTNFSGVHYEYRISQLIPTNTICGDANGYRDYQMIDSGHRVPLIDKRGAVCLLVESSINNALPNEIARLQSDLIGDGWKVYPHTNIVAAEVTAGTTWTNAVWATKQLIKTDYNVDTNTPLYVLIIGHVPVPYSGDHSPGSHSDNVGAHAADLFYADLNGTFTDSSVNDSTADFPFTHNIPGDGKFDQTFLPSSPEVRVGRVDLRNMPAFGDTETQRMKRYLDRNHSWRHKQFTVRQRGLIYTDNNTNLTVAAKPLESHGLFTAYFGNAGAVDLGNWLPSTSLANSYLFAAQQGSGHTNASIQMGTTDNFAATNLYAVFVSTYGSYYGSWDSGVQTNAFMQATLSGRGYTLATWYHENYNAVNSSAMDEPIGYEEFAMQSQQFLIGSGKEYEWYKRVVPFTGTFGVSLPHKMNESLLGDPTLRTRQVAPVSNLTVSAVGSDNVLTWTAPASEPSLEGYHVYRAPMGDLNNFTRLTSSPVNSTGYTDAGATTLAYTYMVRPVRFEDTPNRSLYVAGQGVFVESQ